MKKTTVTINFDAEKLSALSMYLSQKNTTVESELEKSIEALYGKTVPSGVRDFLALKNEEQIVCRTKKKKSVSSAVAVEATHKGEAE